MFAKYMDVFDFTKKRKGAAIPFDLVIPQYYYHYIIFITFLHSIVFKLTCYLIIFKIHGKLAMNLAWHSYRQKGNAIL